MRYSISTIGVAMLFTCFLISCKHEELPAYTPSQADKDVVLPALINPVYQGPFEVIKTQYSIDGLSENESGMIFYPNNAMQMPAPLVLLLHGNGTGGYQNYSDVCQHLASYGFYVASIQWLSKKYKVSTEVSNIRSSIFRHIAFLYQDAASPLKGKISDEIVLIGHSRGGGEIVSDAMEINKVKKVKSIIALAPSPADIDMKEKYTLPDIESLLVIYGSADADVYGGMDNTVNVRKTGFKFFDDAGSEYTNVPLTKDMIFIKGMGHGIFCDISYDQGPGLISNSLYRSAIKGYVTAFLQLHVNNKTNYNDYFKFQKKILPENPNLQVSIQHADGNKLALANFQNQYADQITLYAMPITYPTSTVKVSVNKAALLDATSFHASNTMAIIWMQSVNLPDPVVNFSFDKGMNLLSYKYLSLRAGLIPHIFNQYDKEKKFYIQIIDNSGNKSNLLTVTVPISFYNNAARSYMQSFLLPLNEFTGVDKGNIKSVSLLFTNKDYSQGKIMIDNLEFNK